MLLVWAFAIIVCKLCKPGFTFSVMICQNVSLMKHFSGLPSLAVKSKEIGHRCPVLNKRSETPPARMGRGMPHGEIIISCLLYANNPVVSTVPINQSFRSERLCFARICAVWSAMVQVGKDPVSGTEPLQRLPERQYLRNTKPEAA